MRTENYILVFFEFDEINIKDVVDYTNGVTLSYLFDADSSDTGKNAINQFLIKKLPILQDIKFHLFHINEFIQALNDEELSVDNCFISFVCIVF